jgi:Zn-dependent oligopeptidase
MKKKENFASLDWTKWGVNEIKSKKGEIQVLIKNFLEEVKSLSKQDLNFKNILKKADTFSFEVSKLLVPLHTFEMLHSNKDCREEARVQVLEISKILNELSYNQDIYNQFNDYYNGFYRKEKKNLSGEEVKLVEDQNISNKRNGLHLPELKRKRLEELGNKINKLSSDFNLDTVKNYDKELTLTKAELSGVPDSTLSSFRFDEVKNKYLVKPNLSSHKLAILKNCEVEKTRTKVQLFSEAPAGKNNLKRFGEILAHRSEIAKLLGYKTYLEYCTEHQLLSNVKEIKVFLDELTKGLKDKTEQELKIAKKYLGKSRVNVANLRFVENIILDKEIGLDLNKLSEYFELENTIDAMFKIWEDFFKVKILRGENISIFAEDVFVYNVFKQDGSKQASFIMDLHPREGKYGHACVSDILPRYTGEDEISLTIGALVCNFLNNKNGKTLLSFNDVTTLFHEGGHMLHKILSKNNFTSNGFGDTSVDFVEIPSQFMENFVTTKAGLDLVAKHFKTGEKVPEEIAKKIKYADNYFVAYFENRQSTFSYYDQEIHGKNIKKYFSNPKNLDKFYNTFAKKITKVPFIKFDHLSTHFGHMIGGYQGKYYSYQVSRAYSHECWAKFTKNGLKPRNPEVQKYIKLLENAATVDEMKNLKDFLGKKPDAKTFVKFLKSF